MNLTNNIVTSPAKPGLGGCPLYDNGWTGCWSEFEAGCPFSHPTNSVKAVQCRINGHNFLQVTGNIHRKNIHTKKHTCRRQQKQDHFGGIGHLGGTPIYDIIWWVRYIMVIVIT